MKSEINKFQIEFEIKFEIEISEFKIKFGR